MSSTIGLAGSAAFGFGAEFATNPIRLGDAAPGPLTVGLIDCHRFSRECLATVIANLHADLMVLPFESVQHQITHGQSDIDILIYCLHAGDNSEAAIMRNIRAIRDAIPDVPIVVFSDVEDALQPKTIRTTLSSGAHGFISTRTTGILIAIAAIRFVKAGGTFVPLDQLLTNRPDRTPEPTETTQKNPLTTRQMAVLSHLRQGKANKMIAHELSMSESTVKVHVRNIMRKMGATNRTQVAYKAQQLGNQAGIVKTSD